jgi:hypothetical protein
LTLTNVQGASPAVGLSTQLLSFGAQLVGSASQPLTLTVTNVGGGGLSISSATMGGAQAGDFSLADDGCSGRVVPAGGSCAIDVVFTASGNQLRSAVLTLTDNALGGSQAVSLQGYGPSGVAVTTSTTATVVTSTTTSTVTSTVATSTVTQHAVSTVTRAVTTTSTRATSTSTAGTTPSDLARELGLPSAGACVSSLTVHLRAPAGQKLALAHVTLGSVVRTRNLAHSGVSPVVTFKPLPAGTLKLVVKVQLASGRTLKATQTYKRCAGAGS